MYFIILHDEFVTLSTRLFLFFSYREVTHTHWILQEAFKAAGPAGHALLRHPSVGANTWEAAITIQAALAATSLQLDSTVICRLHSMHRS